ncbi:sodium-dependent glucose transporter 1A-like isoform X1 [Ylistrum balloti]|uniref:sodium-dependent glucose transporter 1A-like isoform X1 n=1 Tax=Ylistrum balloti TaxID=509963 RepID=UPI002905A58A|nr:sodium-dependent glucose transporter 1A-like isoform X1 [Ylistrum balloti]
MACLQGKRCKTIQKQKMVYSIWVYAMFFIIGWIRGLFGPSFIDIQLISNVTLKLGSWISTVNFIGYAIGCLSGGFLYDKISRNFMYAIGLLLIGIVTAGIPWCFLFVLMAAAHFCQGFSSGLVDTVGNAEMMHIWRDNKMMYFSMEFSYSIGVFLAPIVVAPFLSDVGNADSLYHNNNGSLHNVTINSYLQDVSSTSEGTSDIHFHTVSMVDNTSVNLPYRNGTDYNEGHILISRLFVPYTISAVLAILASLPFIARYFRSIVETNKNNAQTDGHDEMAEDRPSSPEEGKARRLPIHLKVVCLALIGSLMFISLCVGEGFMSFIVVYCVDAAGFSPSDGALLSAVSNVCCIAAIVVAMLASRVNTLFLLGVHICGVLAGILGLLISSLKRADIGIWITAAAVGYFRSMIFSLVFTWTNTYITPTTGKISSLYMVCTCTGSAVVPLLLGWLMEEYSDLWFCYLLLILSVCSLLLYILGLFLTKYVTTLYGKTFDRTVVYDISLTESLNKEHDRTVVYDIPMTESLNKEHKSDPL